MMMNPEELE